MAITSEIERARNLAKAGRLTEAEAILREVILSGSADVEALLECSKIVASQGRWDDAVTLAIAATEADGEHVDAVFHLGLCLVRRGRFREASSAFGRCVQLQPGHLAARKNEAMALDQAGLHKKAAQAWREASAAAPHDPQVWVNLARLSLDEGDFKGCLLAAQKSKKLEPQNPVPHFLAGMALAELERMDEAEASLREGLRRDPENPIGRTARGHLLQESGRFEEAEEELRRALKAAPDHGFAYSSIFAARKAGPEDMPELEALAARAQSQAISERDRQYMHYALGKAFEDLKDFERSFTHYEKGNESGYQVWLAAAPWSQEDYAVLLSKRRAYFTAERMAELRPHGRPSKRPVFIVGMIRSGTSLMEQIVSSHPEVAGAGELTFWHENEPNCWDREDQIDREGLSQTAKDYIELLQDIAPHARRVTDKLPHNFALIGEIASAFPEAKFVHCRRNPADNCLSIYTTPFQRPAAFIHDRKNIAFAYREYLRMMEHWREVLPADRLLEVDYEEMVADRESVVRRVIEFIGLDWDDACLRHESNQRAVRTPSLWQVRQPIYTTSIERWRRFEPWIPEFAALVESP